MRRGRSCEFVGFYTVFWVWDGEDEEREQLRAGSKLSRRVHDGRDCAVDYGSLSDDADSLLPRRYHAEPSGTFYRYDAKAIGSGSEGAQAELQNEYHKSLTLAEAETMVLKTLKQVMEEKLDSKNVQLASVTRQKGFRIYGDEEMSEVVARLPAN